MKAYIYLSLVLTLTQALPMKPNSNQWALEALQKLGRALKSSVKDWQTPQGTKTFERLSIPKPFAAIYPTPYDTFQDDILADIEAFAHEILEYHEAKEKMESQGPPKPFREFNPLHFRIIG